MIAVVHCLLAWRVYLLGPKFVVWTENVANTFFNTQKKLSPKQARWQELVQKYDFVWEHKPNKHNQIADALSHKQVQEYVAAVTKVESNFVERIKRMGCYWLEDGLLYVKGGKLYVLSRKIRRELLKETHDPQWAGHPSKERMNSLLSRSYY